MTRNDILALAKRETAELIPGFDVDRMDPAKSLRDYGISSLDLVELVSALMRELKVKIPLEELEEFETLDELVDLLYRRVSQTAAK